MSEQAVLNPFYLDFDAEAALVSGLRAIEAGDPFVKAVKSFAGSLAILGVPGEFINGEAQIEAVGPHLLTLQAADGFRELGFTYTRWALDLNGDDAKQTHDHANQLLRTSHKITNVAADRILCSEIQVTEDQEILLISRQGAALARMARASCAEYAQLSWPSGLRPGVSEAAEGMLITRLQMYAEADRQLGMMGYGLEWLTNALVAARDLRMNGAGLRDDSIKNWLDVAKLARDMTITTNPATQRQAKKIYRRRMFELRNPDTALRAATYPSRV